VTSIEKAPARLLARSDNAWRPKASLFWMTAPSLTGGARSMSTTRVRRRSATSWLRTAFCGVTCRTAWMRAWWVSSQPEMGVVRATRTSPCPAW